MKNRQRWMVQVVGASAIAWATCAAADEWVRETRTMTQPFNEVRLIGALDLQLIQSEAVSLVIEADRGELPRVKSEVHDGVLTLRLDDDGPHRFLGFISKHSAPRALLSARAIERLAVEGSGDVDAGSWTFPSAFELRVVGSGDVKFHHLAAEQLTCSVAGSGDIELAGSTTGQDIRISGSGSYRAADLRSQTASVSVAGSGDAEVWVERILDARIAGSGEVRYYGSPALKQSVLGSGSLTALGVARSR